MAIPAGLGHPRLPVPETKGCPERRWVLPGLESVPRERGRRRLKSHGGPGGLALGHVEAWLCPPREPVSVFAPVDDFESVEEKVLYGAEDNSTFLECVPRSPQASVQWFVQRPPDEQRNEVRLPLHLPCSPCEDMGGAWGWTWTTLPNLTVADR